MNGNDLSDVAGNTNPKRERGSPAVLAIPSLALRVSTARPNIGLGQFNRREAIKIAGAGLLAGVTGSGSADDKPPRRAKKVVVAGGGIGGLTCAYELMKRGHDVALLEASGRPGGHVRTIHDPLPDGLYADIGAEHFTNPGYDQYRKYVEEFNLPVLAYPRRVNMLRRISDKWYTEEQLQDREVLKGFGFNAKEIDFIARHGWTELAVFHVLLRRFHGRVSAVRCGTRQAGCDFGRRADGSRRRH